MPAEPPSISWVLHRRRRVSYRIRALREQRELTQDQLGERSGLERKTINRIERGLRRPDVEQLVRIAWGLDVEPESLFT